MRAIKEARKFIESNSGGADAITLSRLVLALESEIDFPITDIYLLDYDKFKLALEILQEWRLDRHFAGKSRLYDVSMHLAGMTAAGEVPAAGAKALAAAGAARKGKSAQAGKKPAATKPAKPAKPAAAVKAAKAAKPAARKAAATKKAEASGKEAPVANKALAPAAPEKDGGKA